MRKPNTQLLKKFGAGPLYASDEAHNSAANVYSSLAMAIGLSTGLIPDTLL